MVIVISSPIQVKNEAFLINQLFDEGLCIFHIRKPESSAQELVLLLQEINPIHYSKIALHSYHYLAKSFGINRLHFTEASRKQLTDKDFNEFKTEDFILSTSVHSIEDFNTLSEDFEYAFLSPVFDSISKTAYKAKNFNLSIKKLSTKLIALGGVSKDNCQIALEMGFDGVALLGSIWNGDDVKNNFRQISQSLAEVNGVKNNKINL